MGPITESLPVLSIWKRPASVADVSGVSFELLILKAVSFFVSFSRNG